MLSPPTGTPPAPRQIGPYQLLAELGRGGMGAVYRARHVETGTEYALKVILARQTEEQAARAVARFQREIEALARVDLHPGIVRIHGCGVERGHPYGVMELVRGRPLSARLAEGPLPPDEAAGIIAAVADAIEHAHAQGVVHRDLKPQNVLIDADGAPRVVDFGLAYDVFAERLTLSGEVLGTPSYMAPEQVRGSSSSGSGEESRAIGPATDVYGLGAILYEALTGVTPFAEHSGIALMAAVLRAAPQPARRRRADVPVALEAICAKALAKDPGDRYESAAAIAADLRRFVAGESTAAQAERGLASRIRRWRRPLAVLAAVLVVLVAGLVTAVVAGRRRAARRQEAAAELEADWGRLLEGDLDALARLEAALGDGSDALVRVEAPPWAARRELVEALADLARGDAFALQTLDLRRPGARGDAFVLRTLRRPAAEHAATIVAVLAASGRGAELARIVERDPALLDDVPAVLSTLEAVIAADPSIAVGPFGDSLLGALAERPDVRGDALAVRVLGARLAAALESGPADPAALADLARPLARAIRAADPAAGDLRTLIGDAAARERAVGAAVAVAGDDRVPLDQQAPILEVALAGAAPDDPRLGRVVAGLFAIPYLTRRGLDDRASRDASFAACRALIHFGYWPFWVGDPQRDAAPSELLVLRLDEELRAGPEALSPTDVVTLAAALVWRRSWPRGKVAGELPWPDDVALALGETWAAVAALLAREEARGDLPGWILAWIGRQLHLAGARGAAQPTPAQVRLFGLARASLLGEERPRPEPVPEARVDELLELALARDRASDRRHFQVPLIAASWRYRDGDDADDLLGVVALAEDALAVAARGRAEPRRHSTSGYKDVPLSALIDLGVLAGGGLAWRDEGAPVEVACHLDPLLARLEAAIAAIDAHPITRVRARTIHDFQHGRVADAFARNEAAIAAEEAEDRRVFPVLLFLDGASQLLGARRLERCRAVIEGTSRRAVLATDELTRRRRILAELQLLEDGRRDPVARAAAVETSRREIEALLAAAPFDRAGLAEVARRLVHHLVVTGAERFALAADATDRLAELARAMPEPPPPTPTPMPLRPSSEVERARNDLAIVVVALGALAPGDRRTEPLLGRLIAWLDPNRRFADPTSVTAIDAGTLAVRWGLWPASYSQLPIGQVCREPFGRWLAIDGEPDVAALEVDPTGLLGFAASLHWHRVEELRRVDSMSYAHANAQALADVGRLVDLLLRRERLAGDVPGSALGWLAVVLWRSGLGEPVPGSPHAALIDAIPERVRTALAPETPSDAFDLDATIDRLFEKACARERARPPDRRAFIVATDAASRAFARERRDDALTLLAEALDWVRASAVAAVVLREGTGLPSLLDAVQVEGARVATRVAVGFAGDPTRHAELLALADGLDEVARDAGTGDGVRLVIGAARGDADDALDALARSWTGAAAVEVGLRHDGLVAACELLVGVGRLDLARGLLAYEERCPAPPRTWRLARLARLWRALSRPGEAAIALVELARLRADELRALGRRPRRDEEATAVAPLAELLAISSDAEVLARVRADDGAVGTLLALATDAGAPPSVVVEAATVAMRVLPLEDARLDAVGVGLVRLVLDLERTRRDRVLVLWAGARAMELGAWPAWPDRIGRSLRSRKITATREQIVAASPDEVDPHVAAITFGASCDRHRRALEERADPMPREAAVIDALVAHWPIAAAILRREGVAPVPGWVLAHIAAWVHASGLADRDAAELDGAARALVEQIRGDLAAAGLAGEGTLEEALDAVFERAVDRELALAPRVRGVEVGIRFGEWRQRRGRPPSARAVEVIEASLEALAVGRARLGVEAARAEGDALGAGVAARLGPVALWAARSRAARGEVEALAVIASRARLAVPAVHADRVELLHTLLDGRVDEGLARIDARPEWRPTRELLVAARGLIGRGAPASARRLLDRARAFTPEDEADRRFLADVERLLGH